MWICIRIAHTHLHCVPSVLRERLICAILQSKRGLWRQLVTCERVTSYSHMPVARKWVDMLCLLGRKKAS